MPVGLAKSVLKGWHKLFHTEFVPLGGNYLPPFAAKVQSKILGTGRDVIRRQKEQQRTNLGSQIWFCRDQAAGAFHPWGFIVHDLVENAFTKYELCRVRSETVKRDGVHFSQPVNGRDGNRYHFRSKPSTF